MLDADLALLGQPRIRQLIALVVFAEHGAKLETGGSETGAQAPQFAAAVREWHDGLAGKMASPT